MGNLQRQRRKFRFGLKAANGELIAAAAEGHERKGSAIKCIESIRVNTNAPIKDVIK